MPQENTNPLGLEDKLYTVEEFAFALRNKFGGDNTISDVILTEMFLAKYPMYSCKIIKSQNQSGQKSCSCC
ncbi:MAG: hypothetical protein CL844_06060 [Crocinitomicaceae bacterium]|nr:hypothetical protein [Crocinitomicaceae bacterium]|tara:strand:- start:7081 stop:7293 length:213 start_codon:yes stop_codon:yes gene_type:complete